MKKLVLIVWIIILIMALGLGGCASCKNSSIRQAWVDFWHEPAGANWKQIKEDSVEFWHDPVGGNLRQMNQDWVEFWHDPGAGNWELIKWAWRQWLQECPIP